MLDKKTILTKATDRVQHSACKNKIAQFWAKIRKNMRKVNMVYVTNLALLIAIIIVCFGLIINIVDTNHGQTTFVADNKIGYRPTPTIVAEPIIKTVPAFNTKSSTSYKPLATTTVLPVVRTKSGNMTTEPWRVKTETDIVATNQTAKINDKMFGDVIIDSRGAAKILSNGSEINGNLYLQNMRKYILPCNIKINGNMFIRDVNMLQFCGEFEITGNIYVSPRSSFGPIPRNSHVNGQVIL